MKRVTVNPADLHLVHRTSQAASNCLAPGISMALRGPHALQRPHAGQEPAMRCYRRLRSFLSSCCPVAASNSQPRPDALPTAFFT